MPTPRGYRYPAQGAAPNVPLDIQHLAEDVDDDVEAIHDRVTGLEAVTELFHARQTVSQNILDSVFTSITFTTEDIDTAGGHSNVTNNSRYTAQSNGWRRAYGGISYGGSTTGQRYARLALNGVSLDGSGNRVGGSANSTAVPTRTVLVWMNTGDYLELQGHQNSTGTLATTATGELQSTLTVERVRIAA